MADTHSARRPSDARSQVSKADSLSAQEYITQQLQLEADAKEALPYQFDTCTKPLGPLRQSLFSCLTCNPPNAVPYIPAGICYSCSISCHGEHELVELFSKRDFECDCGTTRMPDNSPCTLRISPKTGLKGGVSQDIARIGNKYNHNFAGRFCTCDDEYDPTKEKGTMFQCLGLGHIDSGGCGEDWYHPECLVGAPRQTEQSENKAVDEDVKQAAVDVGDTPAKTEGQADVDEAPLPPGFPAEDEFDHLLCHKCVASNAWIKPYAGTDGFLRPVYTNPEATVTDGAAKTEAGTEGKAEAAALMPPPGISTDQEAPAIASGTKRSLNDQTTLPEAKRTKVDPVAPANSTAPSQTTTLQSSTLKHATLPSAPTAPFSLFLKEDFRTHLCHCSTCYPLLRPHIQLREMEETYEPPVSSSSVDDQGPGSVGSRSLLDRGEAALSTMDRMRAIEGVMAYNNLRDKVKAFLAPFAESGQAVGAEDVKAYFARLRGDEDAIRAAAAGSGDAAQGDGRREQGGY